MSKQDLKIILDDPNKRIDSASNALARLSRLVLSDLDIDNQTFVNMIDNYVKRHSGTNAGEQKSSFKSNLIDALTNSQISFKTFERFIGILNPKQVKFTIELTWRNGTKTEHGLKVDIVNEDEGGL